MHKNGSFFEGFLPCTWDFPFKHFTAFPAHRMDWRQKLWYWHRNFMKFLDPLINCNRLIMFNCTKFCILGLQPSKIPPQKSLLGDFQQPLPIKDRFASSFRQIRSTRRRVWQKQCLPSPMAPQMCNQRRRKRRITDVCFYCAVVWRRGFSLMLGYRLVIIFCHWRYMLAKEMIIMMITIIILVTT